MKSLRPTKTSIEPTVPGLQVLSENSAASFSSNGESQPDYGRLGTDAGIATAVSLLGDPPFHAALLAAITNFGDARHLTHYLYDQTGEIVFSAAVSRKDETALKTALQAYRAGMFMRDPCYSLIRSLLVSASQSDEPARTLEMPQRSRFDAEYRELMFRNTGVADKLSFVHRCANGLTYLNVYFADRHAACTCRAGIESRLLTLLSLAERHVDLLPRQSSTDLDGDLSSREKDVAGLLRCGLGAKEIARELGISPTTVITYKMRIFSKRNVPDLKTFLCAGLPFSPTRVTGVRNAEVPRSTPAGQTADRS